MMKPLFFFLLLSVLAFSSCSKEEATEHERTTAEFLNSVGGQVSSQQWWRTAVTIKVSVTTDDAVKLVLLSSENGHTYVYDRKEVSRSSIVNMTVPQGLTGTLYLNYTYKEKQNSMALSLSGKPEETVNLNLLSTTRALGPRRTPPASLCGNSLSNINRGDPAVYREYQDKQMDDFFAMMDLTSVNTDAKNLNLNCNYELESNGPFYITWVNGYEGSQTSHILGYYYHSANTWKDIVYVDLSETHKWDYIDGLSKVQYKIDHEETLGGFTFQPDTWYDANFDLSDKFGATTCNNMDRVGDNAFNSQEIYYHYDTSVSGMRGISFIIDVPKGMRVGFYLRADEENPHPEQWDIINSLGIKPYTNRRAVFRGTCFCVENLNIVGNGRGKHRSFVKEYDEVIWMGMEDIVEGGDHDCNDVIFGVDADNKIVMPDIVTPVFDSPDDPTPGPDDPTPGPDDPSEDPAIPSPDNADAFPWTIAYEDVNRDADFDFNDVVIQVVPNYDTEECCIKVMAAGSTARMYLHYDGPDGDRNLGEVHDLMGSKNSQTYINTKEALASTPFTEIDCVPWPKDYTMSKDGSRFYIEIQRGTCNDCTDVITLATEPGKMPEALLVAGEWQWPTEGTHIYDTYPDFPRWAVDVTRTRFWEWYHTPEMNTHVTY